MGLPPPPQFDVDTVRTNEIIMKMPRSMLVELSKEELARLRATVRAMVRSQRKSILVDWAAGEDLPAGSMLTQHADGKLYVYGLTGAPAHPHPNCARITISVV